MIWRIYTQERRQLGRLPVTDARLVGPYLLGFHLPNVARVKGVWERSLQRGLTLPQGPGSISIIDMGAGTGAASLATFEALRSLAAEEHFEFELIDRSRHLVQCAANLAKRLAPKAKVKSLTKALNDPQTDHLLAKWFHRSVRLNILCLGYVWNELSPHPRARGHLLETLNAWSQCESPTWLLITEPAAEEGAKKALELRDLLVRMGWQAMYPCLQSNSCPMSAQNRDWCYSELPFKKPPEQVEVEKILGVSRATLGSAAYLFLNGKAAKGIKPLGSQFRTLVGRPTGSSGETILMLCDGLNLDRKSGQTKLSKGELWEIK